MKDFIEKFICKNKKDENPCEWLIQNINNALEEIIYARNAFDMAVTPDNIELAIYELTAAEVKYRNLLKEAKKVGLIITNSLSQDSKNDKCS